MGCSSTTTAWRMDAISLSFSRYCGQPTPLPLRRPSPRASGRVSGRFARLFRSLLGVLPNPVTPARHTCSDGQLDRDDQHPDPRRPGRGTRHPGRLLPRRRRRRREGRPGVRAARTAARTGDESLLLHADLECFVDLNPEQAGVHMSRFEEVVNEAIDTVVLGEALQAGPGGSHRRAGPRAAGRHPRRGEDSGPLSRDRPSPVSASPPRSSTPSTAPLWLRTAAPAP